MQMHWWNHTLNCSYLRVLLNSYCNKETMCRHACFVLFSAVYRKVPSLADTKWIDLYITLYKPK
jgi:hypothetical protein